MDRRKEVILQMLNVLLILMGILGPTPVAGLGGTTSAFITGNSRVVVVARVR